MAFYLKLFNKHSEYETYINDSDKILPNISYCEDNDEVHFNPWSDPRVIAKFNVTYTEYPTTLAGNTSSFSEIEIDGVALPNVVTSYTFNSTGEHTVKYTLSDTTTIGDDAFNSCNRLTSIEIPNSVISIGNMVFLNCTSLTSISVESSNIVYDSRNNCNAIIETTTNKLIKGCQTTIIPNSVTSIGDEAFQGCSGLTSITIPNSVTSIGIGAFRDSGLTSITIPSSVTSISRSAFFNCVGLISINIPNSVTSIGDQAFGNCFGLTSITIPSSVTSIGDETFKYCMSLNSITSLVTTAPTIQSGTFNYVKTGGTLYVPAESTGYDVWMGTGDYYLGKYNWTKVEQ